MSTTDTSQVVTGAGGVVFNDAGQVLVLKHVRGPWVFPKGHVDPGETRLRAALREVEEEAGVKARCPDPATVHTTRYLNDRGEERLIHWYALVTEATQPELREELFPDGAFLESDEAKARLTYPQDRQLLEKMLTWWRSRRESGCRDG